jgi:hypothetical protein
MREKRRMFEKLSLPGPSAGRGAFLMAGYCSIYISIYPIDSCGSTDCIADGCDWLIHTEVVLTPQSSNFSKDGIGALGVSMNSNSLSEPLTLCGLEDMLAIFPIESANLRTCCNSTDGKW